MAVLCASFCKATGIMNTKKIGSYRLDLYGIRLCLQGIYLLPGKLRLGDGGGFVFAA